MYDIILLVAILSPLLASAATAMVGPSMGERSARIGIVALTLSVLGSLLVLAEVVAGEAIVVQIPLGPATVAIVADRLAGVMMTLVSLVSLVIHVYSARYMVGDPGYIRFYALLGLLTFVLLSLVTSGHLLWMLICWHGITWLLATLLAFNRTNPAARDAARRTLWIQGIGDAAFAVAIGILYLAFGTFDLRELFDRLAAGAGEGAAAGLDLGMAVDPVLLSSLCFLLSIMTKSAQFPFHVWLPGTIEAPTPVSALLHAGIVNAGGFLVNRMAPLFGLAPDTMHLMFLIGAVTALVGATTMLTQSSVKRTLVYSTMGQMGYMVMECGLGAYALAVFHLAAHGLFKATLFLNSGDNIHQARDEFRLPGAHTAEASEEFSVAPWATGLGLTLLLPLGILLIGHGLVQVPLFEAQGMTIFLFFAWVTSSQAVFSLYRIQRGHSWGASILMIVTLAFVGITYLWAGEAFTHFLYPGPHEAARFFEAAAWPQGLFDAVVVLAALLVVGAWGWLYAKAHGASLPLPINLYGFGAAAYVHFLNGLYVEDALRVRGLRRPRVKAPLPDATD